MLRKHPYFALWALLASLIVLDFAGVQFGQIADQRVGDMLQRQLANARPAHSDIVVVNIDQKSLEDLAADAGRWPWPRSIHAELIHYIAAQKPQAIVFDLLFNERDVFRPEHDQALRAAAQAENKVYFPYLTLSDGQASPIKDLPKQLGILPQPIFDKDAKAILLLPWVLNPEQWQGGTINFNADSDGIGRHYSIYQNIAGWHIPSLPARLARDFNWPMPQAERMRIHWQTQRQHISYSDLYQAANREHSGRSMNEFTDKIVIIGTAAPGLQDLRPTTMGPLYPGVDILATAIDNLKYQDWLIESPRAPYGLLALLLCSLLALGFARGINTMRLALALILSSGLTLGLMWLGLTHNYYLPLISSLLWAWAYFWLAALIAYWTEKNSREHAVALFSRFLDARVVKQLIASGDIDLGQVAQSREITVLFSDIRGFTSLSEKHDPAAIVQLLNQYFTLQVDIIFKHGGTLDKFIGDAIMAFWGAPANDAEHAQHAVAAALEMSAALDAFKLQLSDIEHFEIGIGLHTGPAVVGLIGSASRLDYTAIGDTVNLASRIEGLTKGCARILVSDATRAACDASFAPFEFIAHGQHPVKGREQNVLLFEPKEKAL
ncbi:adenylate/guanylate cyclase domain-containing protein [uncultured Deefgea sp.]|uniref:adenylate/guanylate cyclase domain-containing protein n=1 Tax=uncultured Deefgea sp. TaxID=1304914 RepID=UPI00262CC161|nr:adenylate/guanylate cyclase domain-containing protein [uncultured Deefgea sp.]